MDRDLERVDCLRFLVPVVDLAVSVCSSSSSSSEVTTFRCRGVLAPLLGALRFLGVRADDVEGTSKSSLLPS